MLRRWRCGGLVAEHNLDLAEIAGDRPLSSLTRYDVMEAAASRSAGRPVSVAPQFLSPPLSTASSAREFAF